MSTAGPVGQLAPEDVAVSAIGSVPEAVRVAAQERVAHATSLAGRPVRDARVVIRQFTNPRRVAASRVEISLAVGGAPVRVRGDAETPLEALDRAGTRAERLIVEVVNRRNDRSRWLSVPVEGQWRRGDLPTERPDHAPLPHEEREIVRRKTFAVAPMTVEEAVYDMQTLDHDFYLFTDADARKPAVVSRSENGYLVSGLAEGAPLPTGVARAPSPRLLSEAEARQRLDVGGERFVFYLAADTGDAAVLYRRDDGHYGLITAS